MPDLKDPVFMHYAIAAALGVLKVMGQGWVTVLRMLRHGGGYASPEDLRPGVINRAPDARQLEPHEAVERSRRMHRNDLENIPAFWIAGLLFALTSPPLWLALLLIYGFVLARAGHAWAYATSRSHEIRATFYTLASLAVICMALWVLAAVLV